MAAGGGDAWRLPRSSRPMSELRSDSAPGPTDQGVTVSVKFAVAVSFVPAVLSVTVTVNG